MTTGRGPREEDRRAEPRRTLPVLGGHTIGLLIAAASLVPSLALSAEAPAEPQNPAAEPSTPAPPEKQAQAQAPAETVAPSEPPDYYYLEPPEEAEAEPAPQADDGPKTEPARRAPTRREPERAPVRSRIYEPPPPGYFPVYEPPPPPRPRHVAPKYALWVGARLGWFLPFGNLWAERSPDPRILYAARFGDYTSSGPMLELDAGARLGRNYLLFLLWERAELGDGDLTENSFGGQTGGDTDFWALAFRATSDADRVGLVTELALGVRRFRATWEDGTELQLTDAPFEARLGVGANLRLSPVFALSPLLTLGAGSFGEVRWVEPSGAIFDEPSFDERAVHYWFTLQLGAHFDLWGTG